MCFVAHIRKSRGEKEVKRKGNERKGEKDRRWEGKERGEGKETAKKISFLDEYKILY